MEWKVVKFDLPDLFECLKYALKDHDYWIARHYLSAMLVAVDVELYKKLNVNNLLGD